MTKISRLSGVDSLRKSPTFANKQILLFTEGELFTHLIQRQLEIKMKYNPTKKRRMMLEQLKSINYGVGVHGVYNNGVHGIGNIHSFDREIQKIISYAQHNPQSAFGGGIGSIDENAIRRACENRIPAPDSSVPFLTRMKFRGECFSSDLCYNNKIKEFHNTRLGRQGFVNACVNTEMKQQIVDNYFEDAGPCLLYKVTEDKDLSNRALTKKLGQQLYGNAMKHITGISNQNLNQFISNGISDKFMGNDAIDVINRFKQGDSVGEPLTAAAIVTIVTIIMSSAVAITEAIMAGQATEEWQTMQQNLPDSPEEVAANQSDWENGASGGNGNDEETSSWLLPIGLGAGGLGIAYAMGLFD